MADRKPAAVQIGRKDGAALSGADIEALLRAQQRQNAAPAQWGDVRQPETSRGQTAASLQTGPAPQASGHP